MLHLPRLLQHHQVGDPAPQEGQEGLLVVPGTVPLPGVGVHWGCLIPSSPILTAHCTSMQVNDLPAPVFWGWTQVLLRPPPCPDARPDRAQARLAQLPPLALCSEQPAPATVLPAHRLLRSLLATRPSGHPSQQQGTHSKLSTVSWMPLSPSQRQRHGMLTLLRIVLCS